MNKPFLFLSISILFLVPSIQYASACGIHGTSGGNDINNWTVTPLSTGINQYEIRFENFITRAYDPLEMCSCVLEVLSDWEILSAGLVEPGTTTLLATFPAFSLDSALSLALESNPLFPTTPETKLVALKNTIVDGSSGGEAADLVFIAQIPDSSESEIIKALENNLLATGMLNSQGTGFEPDHFQILNIILTIVGGELIPIETTSLILAGAQSFSWMIPVVLSGIGIGLFVFRKSENS